MKIGAAGTGGVLGADWQAMLPWFFVLLWSTGFVVARYGMPYAEPMTFLFLRYAGVLLIMVPIILWWRIPLPRVAGEEAGGSGVPVDSTVAMRGGIDWAMVGHIAAAGVMLQAAYLGGVWAAIKIGMPAGLAALIVGMQPILTGMFASFAGERVTARQWLGLLLGLLGVALVVSNKVSLAGVTIVSVGLCVLSLLSITAGTLYQRRFCPVFDLRIGSAIQFAASALVCMPFMFLLETREVQWTAPLIGALLWSVVALSIGAISLLFLLIRKGAATKVSSLMYLTPPTTAVMAWLLFDERFTLPAAAGMLLAVVGVALVLRK